MTSNPAPFYVTTPIYYVNDRPHIGHVYSTVLADALARHARLSGRPTFFLTGTDEHATKVVDAAKERGLSTREWADRNAAEFARTFASLELTHDDFIRTSEDRHKERVTRYVQGLIDSGDVYLGEYEGWYDAGQEEYVPEQKAKESDYKSPVNGKPLVKKREKNYFFRLSAYQDRLLEALTEGPDGRPRFEVRPDARRNEILARVKDGLNDVPMSRSGMADWGIDVPGSSDDGADHQTIYVWIDALFNYLSTVDTEARRHFWPPEVQVIGKDILWFHAAIWPALLMALNEPLPKRLYCHSYWIREGQKMSKTLGNFITIEQIEQYRATFGLDALRWFLLTQGPMGTTDSDFAESKFIETYNGDLANTLGNSLHRVTNMTVRYFAGKLPAKGPMVGSTAEQPGRVTKAIADYRAAMDVSRLDRALESAMLLVRSVDQLIDETAPFTLAKDPARMPEVGTVLNYCAETLRVAAVLLSPAIPDAAAMIFERLGVPEYTAALADRGLGDLDAWLQFGLLPPGTTITKGAPLFMRHQNES